MFIFRLLLVLLSASVIFGVTFFLVNELHFYWQFAAYTLALGIFSATINLMRSWVITCPDPDEYFS
jgi:uncharacterized membrane protein